MAPEEQWEYRCLGALLKIPAPSSSSFENLDCCNLACKDKVDLGYIGNETIFPHDAF